MDRRQFVQSASFGAAGLLLRSVASSAQSGLTRPESAIIPQAGWGRVWIRWTEPALPREPLLAHGLLLPWDAAPSMVESAGKQGYRVYAAVMPEQAPAATISSQALRFSGIILEAGDSEQERAENTARELRLAHPNLTILSTDPRAKQPAMIGSTVITRRGILQVSSPTEQPWIDSNAAMVGFDRAFRPTQTPLIDFQWQLPDALQQQLGPGTESYLLAVAEAGALHSDLILNLHPNVQKALVSGSDEGWAAWKRVAKYIGFYRKEGERPVILQANVGVVTDSYDASYETTNLMARHNIPFRVLPASRLMARDLQGLDLIVVFSQPDEAAIQQMARFVEGGGVAILVSLHSPFAEQLSGGRAVSKNPVNYTMGKGKVIELAEGVADPGVFSSDVRRLLGKENLPISLWNASTTIAIPYTLSGTSKATVDLVNYSADTMPVQVRVKGTYSVVRYETPEQGCCEILTPTHQDGFTQFEVPWLKIGARVHLSAMADSQENS